MQGISMPDRSHALAPTPGVRFATLEARPVAGARFHAWPVFYRTDEDRFYYEAEGWYLVRIGSAEEGQIVFSDSHLDDELEAALLERLGRAE